MKPRFDVEEDIIFSTLDELATKPAWVVMRGIERRAEHRVVVPGEVPWLSAEDWDPTVVVSIDRMEVRLIAISAKRPGHGAFRCLVAAILEAGLIPVIIAPMEKMRAICRHYGWSESHVGAGWFHEEQWRPRAEKKNA